MPETITAGTVLLALIPVIGVLTAVGALLLRKQGMDKAERRLVYGKIETLTQAVNDGFRELGERQTRTETRLDALTSQQQTIHSAVNGGLEDRISRAVRTAMERNKP